MDSMVAIYVALIIKGKKTIDQVPKNLKENMLIDLDLPELAGVSTEEQK